MPRAENASVMFNHPGGGMIEGRSPVDGTQHSGGVSASSVAPGPSVETWSGGRRGAAYWGCRRSVLASVTLAGVQASSCVCG